MCVSRMCILYRKSESSHIVFFVLHYIISRMSKESARASYILLKGDDGKSEWRGRFIMLVSKSNYVKNVIIRYIATKTSKSIFVEIFSSPKKAEVSYCKGEYRR